MYINIFKNWNIQIFGYIVGRHTMVLRIVISYLSVFGFVSPTAADSADPTPPSSSRSHRPAAAAARVAPSQRLAL